MMHPSVNISKKIFEKLKNISEEMSLPMSRLIAIAIDNEFESSQPFTYKIDTDLEEYDEDKYIVEAKKVFNYLKKNFKNGIGYDMLLLCRLDFDISDKKKVLLGCRVLLNKELAEEKVSKSPWNPKGYKMIKIADEIVEGIEAESKRVIIESKGPLND